MKLSLQPLFSGSGGNCMLVQSQSTTLLVDAGVSALSIAKALAKRGVLGQEVDGILITHEHTDHVQGVNQLCKRFGIPVYANAQTYAAMEAKLQNVPMGQARVFTTGLDFYIGEIAVHSFPIPHDAAEPVGYALYAKGRKLCIATDVGYMPKKLLAELEGAQAALLESNYDEAMLETGKYPAYLKRRIRSQKGHLSNTHAGQTAGFLAHTGTRQLLLGHLSKENNRAEIALACAQQHLLAEGVNFGSDMQVHVAKPEHNTLRIVID